MKKIVKQIKNKITFYKFFLGSTLIGVVVLFLSVGINYKYTASMTKVFENNQIKLESLIQNISQETNNKNMVIVKNVELPKEDFMKQYYVIQSDWLNKWLTALAIIMAVLGIMIPICFVKFLENKEKEMDRIIKETIKQKDEMQLQVDDVKSKYNDIKTKSDSVAQKAEQASSDLEKVKSYLEKINIYINEIRAISKYNEGLNKIQEAIKDESKYSEALELYLEANKLDPNKSKYIHAIGKLYCSIKKYDEAIKYILMAIDIDPLYGYYYDLFIIYDKKKDYNNALKYAYKAIDSKETPDELKAVIYSCIARYYSCLGNENKMTEAIQNSLKQNIDMPIVYNNIGIAYMNFKNYKEAIVMLEKYNKKYFVQKEYYNLVESYIYNNDFEKAWKLIQTSKNDRNSTFTFIYNDDYDKWMKKLNESEPSETIDKIKKIIDDQFDKRPREEE